MSTLQSVDEKILHRIKTEIERQSGMKTPTGWVQKDFQFLVYFIEKQTGNRLGLTTVKRIWRNDFQRLPHLTTLNILAQLAFQKNWHTLKLEWVGETNQQGKSNATEKNFPVKNRSIVPYVGTVLGSLFLISVAWGIGTTFFPLPKVRQLDTSTVTFSAQKTAGKKIPNTVLFSYDLSDVEADSFFLQQSWDERRKVRLNKNQHTRTDIYYLPGYYQAKLIADEQIMQEIPVHITSPNWQMGIDQPEKNINRAIPLSFRDNSDYLGVSSSTLERFGVDLAMPFRTGFYRAQEFGVTDAGFDFTFGLKMNDLPTVACPNMSLLLKGENDYYWIMLTNKGCESEIGLKISDYQMGGKTNDLSAFGTTINEWQTLRIKVSKQTCQVHLKDRTILETTYQKSIGGLKEITVFFEGIGQIDEVILKNEVGVVVFADDFFAQ